MQQQQISEKTTSKPELIGIQYLRGLAAIAVVLDHSSGMASLDKYFGGTILDGALTYGGHGVDIFFVLSGFIIVYVSLKTHTLKPSIPILSFFSRRALRILPLMWIAIFSFAALRLAAGIEGNWLEYLRAVVLYPIGEIAPGNIWTLRHEFLFYILFALALLPTLTFRVLIGAWFIAPLVVALAALSDIGLSGETSAALLSFVCSPYNIEFGLGVLLGLIFLVRPSYQRSIQNHFSILILGVTLLVSLTYAFSQELGGLSATLFTAFLAAPIVTFAAFVQPKRRNALALLLGEASYSIYLFHPHFQSGLLKTLSRYAPWVGAYGAAALAACVSILVGIIIHLYLERPLLAFLNRKRKELGRGRVAAGNINASESETTTSPLDSPSK